MSEILYTTGQAAKIIGVDASSVWRYIQAGHIKATKGNRGLQEIFLISETELRRFATRHNFPFATISAE